MENEKINIEMEDMVGKTYFKIASWFNMDFETDKERQKSLKQVSADIIQTVLEDTFLQINGVVKTETKTVSNKENPPKTINQTRGGTGKMFEAVDDPILKALRENK
jgi:hypothetical protein